MNVSIHSKSRTYIVDTRSREIVDMRGRGAPPSADNAAHIVREAIRCAASGLKEYTMPDARNIPAPIRPAAIPSMPRGITVTDSTPVQNLTDDQLMAAMHERYEMFARIVDGATHGEFPAVVISGGPGQGKSSLVETILTKARQDRDVVSEILQGSSVSPITFFETLYKYRHRGNVLVMDDSDTILGNEQGALLLKSAMDSKDTRMLSWGTRATLSDGTPNKFEFRGSIVFLTNQNLRHIVNTGNPMHPRIQHLGAIISRVSYLDLMMHTAHARWLWTLAQIKRHRILEKKGLHAQEQTDVLSFMKENVDRLNEVSIRTAVKMIPFVLMNRRDPSKDWRKDVAMLEFV